jgi:hypothetical protein
MELKNYSLIKYNFVALKQKKQTPSPESESELYRPADRPPFVGEVSANFGG